MRKRRHLDESEVWNSMQRNNNGCHELNALS